MAGQDEVSGKYYDFRREWIPERLERLASVLGLDVLMYAILSNHMHILLRTRLDVDPLGVAVEKKHFQGSAAGKPEALAEHAHEHKHPFLCHPPIEFANSMHCLGEWQGSGATLHSPYECPAHTRCPETGQALPFVGNDSIAAAGLVGGAFSSFSYRLESAFHRSWGLCGGAV
ncbi:MAG: hypothetical protein ACK5OB_18280 [Pirellula sp.]